MRFDESPPAGPAFDYASYDAVALADVLASGEVSVETVLKAAESRTQRLDPIVGAIAQPLFERARRRIGQLVPGARLWGVPMLLKDLRVALSGVPTTNGSRLFRDHVPALESELVRRYEQAGLLIVGKTKTPEFGLNITTEPLLYGPTRNPWDTSRSAGGSSGGAAAAVATGMVPIAHASDGGGSIRVPSSCCGVFGMKVSRGRTPSGPHLGEVWSGLSVEHVITRTVRDSALVLDLTAGAAPGDPYGPPSSPQGYLDLVKRRDPGRLRIAFSDTTASGVPVERTCSAALEAAMSACEALGHEVVERAFTFEAAAMTDAFRVVSGANVEVEIEDRLEELGRVVTPDDLEHATRLRAGYGRERRAVDYARALQLMHRIGREAAAFFESFDVYASPTLAQVPQPLGYFDMNADDLSEFQRRVWAYIPFTAIWNVTGQPSMSVPLDRSPGGLPIGVQFTAPLGGEGVLFGLAAQLEQARPWMPRLEELWRRLTVPSSIPGGASDQKG